jgi:nanoRNase/pAp phosphatase (c-di-AMP/oligoRNAs hydrolase)
MDTNEEGGLAVVEEEKPAEEISSGRKSTYIAKFKKLIEGRKQVAIFTHSCPDPDAIGSALGMKWLLNKFEIESEIYYTGAISHPQNRAMVNLLDIEMLSIEKYSESDFNVIVDTVPSNAGLPKDKDGELIVKAADINVVLDHHKEIPNGGFKGLFVNLKAGSAAATVFSLIEGLGFSFNDDSESDVRVATALMVGITTDTENLMSDDTTDIEFNAWSKLFPCRDTIKLKKIVNFERPKFWTETKAAAISKAKIEEGVAVVGIGPIPGKHRDILADMADEVVKWEDVNTAIIFALVDGDRIEGSVRSKNASVSVPALCDTLGGKHGKGGGKLGKGAYKYHLAGAAVEEDEDDHTKQVAWDMFCEKETKRIFRFIRSK